MENKPYSYPIQNKADRWNCIGASIDDTSIPLVSSANIDIDIDNRVVKLIDYKNGRAHIDFTLFELASGISADGMVKLLNELYDTFDNYCSTFQLPATRDNLTGLFHLIMEQAGELREQ